jgi:hypothetical protein
MTDKFINVELIKEHEDGSATFTFELDPTSTKMFTIYGIRTAIENGIKAGKEWADEPQEKS